jgi:hypothetical protein
MALINSFSLFWIACTCACVGGLEMLWPSLHGGIHRCGHFVGRSFATLSIHRVARSAKAPNDFQLSSLSVFGSSVTGAGKDELFELGDAARDA